MHKDGLKVFPCWAFLSRPWLERNKWWKRMSKTFYHLLNFICIFIPPTHKHTHYHFKYKSISTVAQKPTLSILLCQLNNRNLMVHWEYRFVFTPILICFNSISIWSYAYEDKRLLFPLQPSVRYQLSKSSLFWYRLLTFVPLNAGWVDIILMNQKKKKEKQFDLGCADIMVRYWNPTTL